MQGSEPPLHCPERYAQVVKLLGLGAEHATLARRLRADLLHEHAVDMVDACLFALSANEDFSYIQQASFDAAFRRGWIDILQGFGRRFASQDHAAAPLAFSAACARAGIPLSLLLLQHGLIQRALIARVESAGMKEASTTRMSIDRVLGLCALNGYLLADGYRSPDNDALRKLLEELREKASRLHRQATTDQLTGLATFGSLQESLERQIVKARERDQPLGVLMADLDYFKQVNDIHGHLVGDMVLRHVAARIQSAVRDFDIVGRFGGEEFTVILMNTDVVMASIIAERIREEIASTPFHIKGIDIHITISLGVAMLREDDTRDGLLERADEAMYQAKQAGRNRVIVAS